MNLKIKSLCHPNLPLTLIYPAHFEDVPCQSGVNHIYEGYENYVSRQGIYHSIQFNSIQSLFPYYKKHNTYKF